MAFRINGRSFTDRAEFSRFGRGCATKHPNEIEILRVDDELRINRPKCKTFETLTIQLKFTHITYGASGLITELQREQQIERLNFAFKETLLKFDYTEADTEYVDNFAWYNMGHLSVAEREAKTELSQDTTKILNFYTAGLQPGLLGWATFPFDLAGDPVMDGVVVLDESLPDGNAEPFNLGMTGVHEVGHWLGLYHTFQDGCNGFGDHINDTPAHSGPNYGTPEDGLPHNACKEDEFAPIRNYMNYVDDEWMTELTKAQSKRIQDQIMMYRTGLLNT